MTGIHSLNDLRPGDLMFGPIHGAVGAAIDVCQIILGEGFRIGRVHIEHAAVVTREAGPDFGEGRALGHGPRIAQAMPGGCEEIEIGAEHWTPEFAYCRPPYRDAAQANLVAFQAREMVLRGVEYSFATYPALTAWKLHLATPHLTRWINRRDAGGYPLEVICSQFDDDALTLGGFQAFNDGRPERCVTPGQLAGEFIFRHPGTLWGGAAWEGPRVGPFTAAPR